MNFIKDIIFNFLTLTILSLMIGCQKSDSGSWRVTKSYIHKDLKEVRKDLSLKLAVNNWAKFKEKNKKELRIIWGFDSQESSIQTDVFCDLIYDLELLRKSGNAEGNEIDQLITEISLFKLEEKTPKELHRYIIFTNLHY